MDESSVPGTVPGRRKWSMNIRWITKLIINSGGQNECQIVIELCFLQQSLEGNLQGVCCHGLS